MSTKKVVLHPLERLDIVDAQALQDLSHSAVEEFLGASIGNTSAGTTNPWNTVTLDTIAETMVLGDFAFLGRRFDDDGHQRLYPCYLGKYRSGNHTGTLSYGTAKALVQNYFNVNGVLPPQPQDEGYDLTSHGAFYPLIYCRPVVTQGSEDTRRFWSASVNNEVSRDVNTRTSVSFLFEIVSPTQAPSAVTGYAWTRVGQIRGWTETDGVVSLDASEVRAYTLADSMLNLDDNQLSAGIYPSANRGGITQAIAFMKALLDDVKQNGASDPTGTEALADYAVPPLSMMGLIKSFENLEASVTSTKRATAIVRIIHSADFPTISVTNTAESDFSLGGVMDFSYLRELQNGTETLTYDMYNNQVYHMQAAMRRPVITLPSTFTGRAAQVTITNLHSLDPLLTDLAGENDYSVTYDKNMVYMTYSIIVDSEATRGAALGPRVVNYQTESSSTSQEAFGFALDVMGPAASTLYFSTDKKLVYIFKVDVTIL